MQNWFGYYVNATDWDELQEIEDAEVNDEFEASDPSSV